MSHANTDRKHRAHQKRDEHTLTTREKPDSSSATHQGCLNKSPPPRMNTGKEGAVRSPIEGINFAQYRICQRNFKFETTTRGSATRSRPTYRRSKTRMYADSFKHGPWPRNEQPSLDRLLLDWARGVRTALLTTLTANRKRKQPNQGQSVQSAIDSVSMTIILASMQSDIKYGSEKLLH